MLRIIGVIIAVITVAFLLFNGAVMLASPKGLWGLIASRLGWQMFPLERRVTLSRDDTMRA